MKRTLLIPATLALALGGCAKDFTAPQLNETSASNEWMVRSYQEEMVDNAIVRQSTVYPYHFVANGAALNELGVRDLGTLADHFVANPGRLNVRRADSDAALYAARVQTVRDSLASQGVDGARIVIEDGVAGGDGAVAERTVRVLAQDTEDLETVTSTRESSGGASSSSR